MSKFKPMLAASTVPDLNDINYPVMASPKLDGIRCVTPNGDVLSRNLKAIPNHHVRHTLQALRVQGLDGELMIDGDLIA
jgi:DNA ligase-1